MDRLSVRFFNRAKKKQASPCVPWLSSCQITSGTRSTTTTSPNYPMIFGGSWPPDFRRQPPTILRGHDNAGRSDATDTPIRILLCFCGSSSAAWIDNRQFAPNAAGTCVCSSVFAFVASRPHPSPGFIRSEYHRCTQLFCQVVSCMHSQVQWVLEPSNTRLGQPFVWRLSVSLNPV